MSYQCIVTCAFIATALAASLISGCPSEYLKISKDHTMCRSDVGTIIDLTQAEKDAAVAEHNKIRARVDPKAAHMKTMTWNDDLAKVAAKWAAQCVLGHDEHDSRKMPSLDSMYIGQNLVTGKTDLVWAIQSWEKEIKDFNYGSQPTGTVGDYTQIVDDTAYLVGCGRADCPSSTFKKFVICNYGVGQMENPNVTPYDKAE